MADAELRARTPPLSLLTCQSIPWPAARSVLCVEELRAHPVPPHSVATSSLRLLQVLAFVEQLGTHWPVESPQAGELIDFLLEDGDPVEYNEPVAEIAPFFGKPSQKERKCTPVGVEWAGGREVHAHTPSSALPFCQPFSRPQRAPFGRSFCPAVGGVLCQRPCSCGWCWGFWVGGGAAGAVGTCWVDGAPGLWLVAAPPLLSTASVRGLRLQAGTLRATGSMPRRPQPQPEVAARLLTFRPHGAFHDHVRAGFAAGYRG